MPLTLNDLKSRIRRNAPTTRTFAGLTVRVENEPGTVRSGIGADGEKWSTLMQFPYGEIPRVKGMDGDYLDVTLGPDEKARDVYLVNQLKADGKTPDEQKAHLGFTSMNDARACYLAHHSGNEKLIGSITTMPIDRFRTICHRGEIGSIRWRRKRKLDMATPIMFAADSAMGKLRGRIAENFAEDEGDVVWRTIGAEGPDEEGKKHGGSRVQIRKSDGAIVGGAEKLVGKTVDELKGEGNEAKPPEKPAESPVPQKGEPLAGSETKSDDESKKFMGRTIAGTPKEFNRFGKDSVEVGEIFNRKGQRFIVTKAEKSHRVTDDEIEDQDAWAQYPKGPGHYTSYTAVPIESTEEEKSGDISSTSKKDAIENLKLGNKLGESKHSYDMPDGFGSNPSHTYRLPRNPERPSVVQPSIYLHDDPSKGAVISNYEYDFGNHYHHYAGEAAERVRQAVRDAGLVSDADAEKAKAEKDEREKQAAKQYAELMAKRAEEANKNPPPKPKPTVSTAPKASPIVRVRGNTYPHKETLKSMGFRWNPDEKTWYRPRAGFNPSSLPRGLSHYSSDDQVCIFATPLDAMRFRIAENFASDEDSHWITIGGSPNEKGQQHEGGTHVEINSEGKITAGPQGLVGHKPESIPPKHRQEQIAKIIGMRHPAPTATEGESGGWPQEKTHHALADRHEAAAAEYEQAAHENPEHGQKAVKHRETAKAHRERAEGAAVDHAAEARKHAAAAKRARAVGDEEGFTEHSAKAQSHFEAAKGKQPTPTAPASPPSASKKASVDEILSTANSMQSTHGANGLLPMHHLRDAIEAKYGKDAVSKENFDIPLKRARGNGFDLVSSHEPSMHRDKYGDVAMNKGIQGADETFHYVRTGGVNDAPPKSAPLAQPHNTANELFQQAQETKPHYDSLVDMGEGVSKDLNASSVSIGSKEEFDAMLDQFASGHKGAVVIMAPIKGQKRAIEKATEKYGGNFNKLHDLVRGTVAVDHHEDIPEAMEAIKQHAERTGFKIVSMDDRFANPTEAGYRDMQLKLQAPNGHITELQVNTKPMILAKQRIGHRLYEEARRIAEGIKFQNRDATPEEKSRLDHLNAEMAKAYDEAWKKSQRGAP